MRCVYLGLPEGAKALIDAGHRLLAIGLERPCPDLLREAIGRNCPLLDRPDLSDPVIRGVLVSTGAPVLLCYLWGRIIPPMLFESFSEGAISYHPSLLPRHRGPDPYFWTIYSGDRQAGASVLRLDAGVDTGPVLAQRSIEVPPGCTGGALADILDPIGLELLLEVAREWELRGPVSAAVQDGGLATRAPKPDEELVEIRWSEPADRIARLVMAAAPYPGAFTALRDGAREKTISILAAHEAKFCREGALRPGDAVLIDEGVMIWTGKGGLVLDRVRTDEGAEYGEIPSIASIFRGLADLRVG